MSETCPETIGRYEVLTELGHGAMGIVYKARDPQLDRIVAIKTLRVDLRPLPDDRDDFRLRFHREAMAAGRLTHAHIVAIYDVLEIDETPYIVMEYVEGETLAHLLAAEGPFRPRRAVEIVLQVCRALEYAHARGVVHRDIKPANILLAGGREVKVSDFGIARIAGTKLTQTGALLGSPSYMSPEQVKGLEVDGRSDLFSLGVVLYEALAGADPFSGESPSTVLYKIVHEEPAPLLQRARAVAPALDAVVRRVLAKDPGRRYPTARAFADDLARALGEAAAADTVRRQMSQDTVVLERPPEGRRVGVVRIGATCLLIAAVGGAALWARSSGKGTPVPEPASRAAGEVSRAAAAQAAGDASPKKQATEPGGRTQKAFGGNAVERNHSVAGVTARARPSRKREAGRGSIRITTNPSVEVLVDGRSMGRAGRGPFVMDGVAIGRRVVALRLGPVEQRFQGTVREDKPFSLTYYFPSEAPRAGAGEAYGGAREAPLPIGRH